MTRLLSLAAAVLFAVPAVADDSTLKVKVGDKFPDIAVPATQIDLIKKGAKEVGIADLKGKVVVVAFYPKALTGGCTTECNAFNAALKDFPKDTVILGASADPLDLNQKFTDTHTYGFPLLCDTELKLIKALGIKMAQRDMAQRVTFLVDREGKIAKIYNAVKPAGHAAEVLKDVKELK
jgi:thioredoxin-dependent peroxiredoxin